MIRVEGLYKSFDNKTVLSDINVVFESKKVNLIAVSTRRAKAIVQKHLSVKYPAKSICQPTVRTARKRPQLSCRTLAR